MDEIFAAAEGGLKKLRESHDVWCSMIDVQVEMQGHYFITSLRFLAVLCGRQRRSPSNVASAKLDCVKNYAK
jgi:hypothetical protein